jgi:hypothetical protein
MTAPLACGWDSIPACEFGYLRTSSVSEVMKVQMSEAIFVGANTWLGWREYARRVDYVPDPMTLRTAELFFNG